MSIVLFSKTPTQRAIALIRGQFSAGQPGLWYEFGTFDGLYQDSAGTTPVTAVTQPVGLMLDKRLGLVLGPELVTNGDFSNGTTGWTPDAGATFSVSAGVASVKGIPGYVAQSFATVIGKSYRISGVLKASPSLAAFAGIRKSDTATATTNTVTIVSASNPTATDTEGSALVVATATTTFIVMQSNNNGTALFDGITCKLFDGNHILQATAGARPLLQESTFKYLTFDGTNDGMATGVFAAGTLTADMDCFIAIKRNSSAKSVLLSFDASHHFGTFDSAGGAATASNGVGASGTYLLDGVAVPGGTGTTQAQLNTALIVSAWHVLEVHNLDLSAFTQLKLSLYGAGYFVNGNIKDVILLPAQSDANRSVIRKYLGSKVGLAL